MRIGEAYCLLEVVLERIGEHKFGQQVYVGKNYHIDELVEDLKEIKRLLDEDQ